MTCYWLLTKTRLLCLDFSRYIDRRGQETPHRPLPARHSIARTPQHAASEAARGDFRDGRDDDVADLNAAHLCHSPIHLGITFSCHSAVYHDRRPRGGGERGFEVGFFLPETHPRFEP